jgi:hypothetical protein
MKGFLDFTGLVKNEKVDKAEHAKNLIHSGVKETPYASSNICSLLSLIIKR